MNTNTIATTLATVALALVAQACCGGLDPAEADRVLRVTVEAEPTEIEAGAPAQKLCGAEVVAIDDDGEQIALAEVQGDNGCEYIADVDPNATYTIAATHPQAGGANAEHAQSNPSCSTPTASEDIDNSLSLSTAQLQPIPQAEQG